jgi:hypothetical protein
MMNCFFRKKEVIYLTPDLWSATADRRSFPLQFGEGEGELPEGSSEGGEVISNIFAKTQ